MCIRTESKTYFIVSRSCISCSEPEVTEGRWQRKAMERLSLNDAVGFGEARIVNLTSSPLEDSLPARNTTQLGNMSASKCIIA